MIDISWMTTEPNPFTSCPRSLPLWGPYRLPPTVSTCCSFPQNYTIKSFTEMELKFVIPSVCLELCLHSSLFNCGYAGFDGKWKLMCSEMDVTDDGLLQEIQHLSIYVFLPPNWIFLRYFSFQGQIGFSLICSICCFLATAAVQSTTDIVKAQNEIHYHYSHSPGSGVIATVREAAAAALLCLKWFG